MRVLRRAIAFTLAVAALTHLTGAPARASDPPPIWGEVELPGGVVAARQVFALGGGAGRLEAALLSDFVRRHVKMSTWNESSELFGRYVEYLASVRTGARQWPGGVRLLAPSAPKADRERVKTYLELIGLDVREARGSYSAAPGDSGTAKERSAWLGAAGIDLSTVAARLNAGEAVPIAVEIALQPLPLPQFWQANVFERGHMPAADLMHDRASALLYDGLLALDDETLRYLAERPRLVKKLRDDSAGAFSTFAPSLRIRQGAIDLPGGIDAVPIWKNLVGTASSDVEAFLEGLFAKDDGRLACFYDAVDRLDTGRRTFWLGSRIPAKLRVSFVHDLYDRFAALEPGRKTDGLPTFFTVPDPAIVMSVVDVDAAGGAGPAWFPWLLDRVAATNDWPTKPAQIPRALQGASDALWTLGFVFERPKGAADRLGLLRFAQRQFMNAGKTSLPDVEAAMRGYRDMPALMLTLERIGMTDPSLLARVARAAHALTVSGDVDRVMPALVRWQSALSLIEQIQRRRHLAARELEPLVSSLADTALLPPERIPGSVAAWIVEQLVAKVVPQGTSQDAVERTALESWLGAPTDGNASFVWEGLPYVVDLPGPSLRDALALRATSSAPSLGTLVELHAVLRRLERGPATLEDVKQLIADLGQLESAIALIPVDKSASGNPSDLLREILKALGKITRARDLKNSARQAPALRQLVDALTDAVAPPLAYALAMVPLAHPAIYADAWRHHPLAPPHFGSTQPWQTIAWQYPKAAMRPEGGAELVGSYLGLDVALAESQLRPVAADGPVEGGPNMIDRALLVSTLVVRDRQAATDAAVLGTIVARLQEGRRIAGAWAVTPPSRDTLRAALMRAGVDPLRAGLLTWVAERSPARVSAGLTLTELFRLGAAGDLPVAWGVPSMPFDGCLCFQAPSGRTAADYREYWVISLSAALTTDLPLHLAEYLAQLKLPLSLVPDLLPAAMQEWVNHIQQYSAEDWEALTLWPKRLTRARVEEYLNGLVTQGILVAPHRGGHP